MSTMTSPLMQPHQSLGLATVVTDLVTEGSTILDLGPISSGTADCFKHLKCKCYVEDLVEYLESLRGDEADAVQKLNDHLLPKPESLKFDVILCWDIFNFLDLDTIEFLIDRLSPHFKTGTVLHAMHYPGSVQPMKPKRFELLEDFSYRIAGNAYRVQVAAKPHSTAALLEHMQQFSLRRKLLNREGMPQGATEVLLEFDAQASQKPRRKVRQSNRIHQLSAGTMAAPVRH